MTRRHWIDWLASRTFPAPEELVIETSTGRVLLSSFLSTRREPVGSLVKVFAALAYGERHQFSYPDADCKGFKTGCWYTAGHGRIGLVDAVAYSCNSYFLMVAGAVTQQDVSQVAQSYSIAPPLIDSPEARIGLGRGWLETPEAITLAYVALARRRNEPGVSLIVEGLRKCALQGTAKSCGAGVLAKTGTSVCVHRPSMPGDGWALGLFPEAAPRYAVLVREHGVPGATAAIRLSRRISALREGR